MNKTRAASTKTLFQLALAPPLKLSNNTGFVDYQLALARGLLSMALPNVLTRAGALHCRAVCCCFFTALAFAQLPTLRYNPPTSTPTLRCDPHTATPTPTVRFNPPTFTQVRAVRASLLLRMLSPNQGDRGQVNPRARLRRLLRRSRQTRASPWRTPSVVKGPARCRIKSAVCYWSGKQAEQGIEDLGGTRWDQTKAPRGASCGPGISHTRGRRRQVYVRLLDCIVCVGSARTQR